MIRAVLSALIAHWRRRPGQLLTLVLGLALATALWSAVQAINAEARASYAEAAQGLSAASQARIVPVDGVFALEDFARLRRAGWPVTPVLSGSLDIGGEVVPLDGVDMVSRSPDALAPTASEDPDLATALMTPPGRLLASPDLAARIRATDLPPVVVSDAALPGRLLTDIATAERLLDRTGEIDRFDLTGPAPAPPELGTLVANARLVAGAQTDTARLTDSFHLNLTAFGFLSFAVGLFVVHGVAGLAFEERRATFRTLRALGVPLGTLTWLLLAELVALALISGVLGVALGYGVAAALLPDVSASLRGLYGAQVSGGLQLRASWVLGGLGMALAGALLAGAQGVAGLRRLPLLAGASTFAWAGTARWRARVLALVGVGLMIVGAGLLLVGGLVAGFAALAGLMVGAALVLPVLLDALLQALARRSRGPAARWIWADMAAQLPGLSLALMALLLALAANIGVGTMVSSFRLTFTGWLDQRLAAELYVTLPDATDARAVRDWLTPRADAVLPIRHAEVMLEGTPGRLYGIVDHATYRDNWPLVAARPDAWDDLATGAVFVNEQLARGAGLWLGDVVTLGPGWQAPIAAVYSDYGNPRPQGMVAMATLLAHHPGIADDRFGLRTAAPAALARDLRAAFDLPADAVVDQNRIKDASLAVFEKTFLVTGALNVLTLGVAGFAILTSLMALWRTRLPQLAPVWAQGLSRRQLALLEVARSTGLAGFTALAALPLGLLLAWVLLAVINVAAFGWRLPIYLFPLDWLRLGALALMAGALAAVIPARRLMRLPPAQLLKVFASER